MKSHPSHRLKAIVGAALLVAAFGAQAGGTYKFTVSCQAKRLVAQWNTGSIDPGKEFLRVSTGTKHPGCGITDFNPQMDANLPVEVYSGPTGVIQGIPLLGPLLGHIFGF